MTKGIKYIIIGLSVLSAAGVGYFVYSKIKISSLNKKISTIGEAYQKIGDMDVTGIVIQQKDITVDPEVPLYGGTSDDVGTPDASQYTEQSWTDYFDEFMYGSSSQNSYTDDHGTVLYTDHG